METISSRANPKIKSARALRQRKQRDSSGLFLVEGIHHVGAAVEAGAAIEEVHYAPDLLKSQYALEMVEDVSGVGVPCFPVTVEVFNSLADKENPQGILAVVRQRQEKLVDLNPGNFAWGAVCVAPQDPGNVGTILRTVDAVGASGLLLLAGGVDPYLPTAVRASMGAILQGELSQGGVTVGADGGGDPGLDATALHVRLDGPRKRRIARIQESMEVSAEEAERLSVPLNQHPNQAFLPFDDAYVLETRASRRSPHRRSGDSPPVDRDPTLSGLPGGCRGAIDPRRKSHIQTHRHCARRLRTDRISG